MPKKGKIEEKFFLGEIWAWPKKGNFKRKFFIFLGWTVLELTPLDCQGAWKKLGNKEDCGWKNTGRKN